MIPLWAAALLGLAVLALGFWRGWLQAARIASGGAAQHEDTCPARRPAWLYCQCGTPPDYVTVLRRHREGR